MPFSLILTSAYISEKIHLICSEAIKILLFYGVAIFTILICVEYFICGAVIFEAIRVAIGISVLGILAVLSFYYMRKRGWSK